MKITVNWEIDPHTGSTLIFEKDLCDSTKMEWESIPHDTRIMLLQAILDRLVLNDIQFRIISFEVQPENPTSPPLF